MTDPQQPDPTSAPQPPSEWARPATDPTATAQAPAPAPAPAPAYPTADPAYPADPAAAGDPRYPYVWPEYVGPQPQPVGGPGGFDTTYDPLTHQFYVTHGYPTHGFAGPPHPHLAPPPYGYGYGWPAPARTNGLAIGAMVTSICAFALMACTNGLTGFIGIVGAILGHVARRQIRERGEAGGGFAMAGIVVGWIATALSVVAIVLLVLFFAVGMSEGEFDTT